MWEIYVCVSCVPVEMAFINVYVLKNKKKKEDLEFLAIDKNLLLLLINPGHFCGYFVVSKEKKKLFLPFLFSFTVKFK